MAGPGPLFRADDVVDAFGVNVHFDYTGSVYDTKYSALRDRLTELGIRHIRSGYSANTTVQNRYQELGGLGIGMMLTNVDGIERTSWINSRNANGAKIEALESPNEWDQKGTGWQTAITAYVKSLFNTYTGDGGTNPLPFLGPAFANTRDSAGSLAAVFTDAVNYLDVGNLHDYNGAMAPEGAGGAGWGISVSSAITRYQALSGTAKGIWATECGNRLSGGVVGQSAVTQRAAAKYALRTVLNHLLNGISRSYLYQLIENGTGYDYGLLNNDGTVTARPAFTAIKNFLSLIADPGPAFTAPTLAYQLGWDVASINYLTIAKRDGSYWLAVWQGVQSAVDAGANDGNIANIEPARVSATLSLPSGITLARVYEPTFSGTTPVNTYVNPSSIVLSVPDHVMLVEMRTVPVGGIHKPAIKGSAGGATTATTGLFTPTPYSTLLAFVAGRRGALPAQPTISDSLGLTWTPIDDNNQDDGAGTVTRLRVFRTTVGQIPAEMSVTGTISNAGHMGIVVAQIEGAGSDFSNYVWGKSNTGDPAATLSPVPASTSAIVSCAVAWGTQAFAPGSTGLVEAIDAAFDGALRIAVGYDIDGPGASVNWTSNGTGSLAFLLELKVPPGRSGRGALSVTPQLGGKGNLVPPFTLGSADVVGNGGSATTIATTNAFTPVAFSTLVVFIAGRSGSAPGAPSITDSAGLTWNQVKDTLFNDGSGTQVRLRSYRAVVGANPPQMTVTGTVASAGHTGIVAVQITGGGTDYSNSAAGTNSAGDPAATLSPAPGIGSGVLTCAVGVGSSGFAPNNVTELFDATLDPGLRMAIGAKLAAPSAGVSWVSTNTQSIAQIIELKLIPVRAGIGNMPLTLNLGGKGQAVTGGPTLSAPTVRVQTGAIGSSVTAASFIPSPNSTLIAFIGGRSVGGTMGKPQLGSNRGLGWNEIDGITYDDGSGTLTKLHAFWASASALSTAITANMTGCDDISLVVVEFTGNSVDFANVAFGASPVGDPFAELPETPFRDSSVIGIAIGNGTGKFQSPADLHELIDYTAGNSLQTAFGFDAIFSAQTGGWTSGNLSTIGMLIEVAPAGVTEYVDPSDIIVPVRLGGRGGRFFIPVEETPGFRGLADRAFYEVYFDMAPGSRWVITQDVRAVSISRDLSTWPGEVTAGTADFLIDNAEGIYSPLNKAVHRGNFRPNLPINVIATFADLDGIVSSYFLFRGLVDAIAVDPAPDQQTVSVTCRDYWKEMQLRLVSTSMMIEYGVSSVLAVAFNAASLGAAQRSIDLITDALPFAWYTNKPLSDVLTEMVAGAGYATYVAANGVVRVRDRYFDVGVSPVASYDSFAALSWTYNDDNLINRVTAVGHPRFHDPIQQVVSSLGQMITVPASGAVSFFLNYADPRNQQAAPAANVVTNPVASRDFILNANSAGTGTFFNSTASVQVTAFGDAAKVDIFNGAGQLAYVTKFQIRGEPIEAVPDVTIVESAASSQAVYGLRDGTVDTRLFTTVDLLTRRVEDVLALFSDPRPQIEITQIDSFPESFLVDLGSVVTITNTLTGITADQYTVYGLRHEIRADDAGLIHQVGMTLRQSQAIEEFHLDADHLDVDRIGR